METFSTGEVSLLSLVVGPLSVFASLSSGYILKPSSYFEAD